MQNKFIQLLTLTATLKYLPDLISLSHTDILRTHNSYSHFSFQKSTLSFSFISSFILNLWDISEILVGEWWCWWGVGNIEREREKERERQGMMRMGAGERERKSQPASQPARQKEKGALKNEKSVFRNDSKLESISFSKKYFKTYLSLPPEWNKVNNTTRKQKDNVLRLELKVVDVITTTAKIFWTYWGKDKPY